MRTKDENYWKVLDAAVRLDLLEGHLKWSYASLSRRSGVSRTLIYYYFGKEKLGILREACRMFGAELAGVVPRKTRMWEAGEIAQGILASRELLEKAPAIAPFYFRYRAQEGEIGTLLRKSEADFHAKIRRFFPGLGQPQREAFFAAVFGFAFAPGVSAEAVGAGVRALQDWAVSGSSVSQQKPLKKRA